MAGSRGLLGATIVLASFLLLLSEPIVAKQLLPLLGGSAAVWVTCLVFFQTTLLLGYLYAHWLVASSPTRTRGAVHLLLLAAAVFFALLWAWRTPTSTTTGDAPLPQIVRFLSLSIGVPFLLLSSTSPLLTAWYRTLAPGLVPYRLFGVSNVAALLALLLYPAAIEPHLTLRAQRVFWAAGVCAFATLSAALLFRIQAASALPHPPLDEADGLAAPSTATRSRILWFLLPMIASMQLSAVTSHLTTNIAAIPLLWILPLAAYLLTFIAAFQTRRVPPRVVILRLLAVMLAGLGYVLSKTDVSVPISMSIVFFLAELLLACLFCHAEAYDLRPQQPREATLFYLSIAAGGAAGSFLLGIVAPLIFRANYDLPLSFFATALLALAVVWNRSRGERLLWITASALLLLLGLGLRAAYWRGTLMATRNFYGSLRVRETVSPQGTPIRILLNGTIEHGTQMLWPELRTTPTTYYAEDSGVGLALRLCCGNRSKHVGVIGLGVGTLAAYAHAGDSLRFYELNPAVEPVARNLFTYLRASPATITIVNGDARSSLETELPQRFDVLIVDAFTGDAIPIHLLTRQAMTLYRRHLAPGGLLLFHVSNQYVDLAPEIALLAADAGFQARLVESTPVEVRGEFRALWVIVAADDTFFREQQVADRIAPIPVTSRANVWTDDFSSLFRAVRW